MGNLDPTIFAETKKPDINKKKLENQTEAYRLITERELFQNIRNYSEGRYKALESELLEGAKDPQETMVIAAQMRIHKEYQKRFDEIEQRGKIAKAKLKEAE